MVESDIEKITLKFLHVQNYLPLLPKRKEFCPKLLKRLHFGPKNLIIIGFRILNFERRF